jgi:hypothetical protein
MTPVIHLASNIVRTLKGRATFQVYCFRGYHRDEIGLVDDAPTCLLCIEFHARTSNRMYRNAVHVVVL